MSLKNTYQNILSNLKSVVESTPTIQSNSYPVWIGAKIQVSKPPTTEVFIVPSPVTVEPITVEPTRTYRAEFQIIVVKSIKETDKDSLSTLEQDTMLLACEIVDKLLEDITLGDTVRELQVTNLTPVLEIVEDYRVSAVTITVVTLFEL